MTKPCLLSAERLKEIEEHAKNIAHAMPNTSQDINELLDHIGALNEMIAASSAPIGDGEIEELDRNLGEAIADDAVPVELSPLPMSAKRLLRRQGFSEGAIHAIDAIAAPKVLLLRNELSLSQAALAKAEKERDELSADLQDARAALEKQGYRAWLIESKIDPVWLYAMTKDQFVNAERGDKPYGFTKDANKALQFARREDAEACLFALTAVHLKSESWLHATEHEFAALPQSRSEGT